SYYCAKKSAKFAEFKNQRLINDSSLRVLPTGADRWRSAAKAAAPACEVRRAVEPGRQTSSVRSARRPTGRRACASRGRWPLGFFRCERSVRRAEPSTARSRATHLLQERS